MPEPDGYINVCSKITAHEARGLVVKSLTEYNEIVCSIRDAATKGLVGVNVDIIQSKIVNRLESDGFALTHTNNNKIWIYWGE